MLGVASKGELFSQNPEVAIGLGLLAAAGGLGVGLAAASGIEVMSGIRTMSEKVATKLHEKAEKRYEKAKQILGKGEEEIMGPGLSRVVKKARDFTTGHSNK